jgi:hypothetical protein
MVNKCILREYGQVAFEYAERNSEYGEIFNRAMSSYSAMHTNWILDALDKYDFSNMQHLCDIGEGQGHLLSRLLLKYSHISGSILDSETIIKNKELLWANKIGVGNRCQHIKGNMFHKVPFAVAYIMKLILHEQNVEECIIYLLMLTGLLLIMEEYSL